MNKKNKLFAAMALSAAALGGELYSEVRGGMRINPKRKLHETLGHTMLAYRLKRRKKNKLARASRKANRRN